MSNAVEGGPEIASPRYYRRKAAAEYLKRTYGFGSVKTLANGAVSGDTPRFYKFGRIVLYKQIDLDAWAQARISARSYASSLDASSEEE